MSDTVPERFPADLWHTLLGHVWHVIELRKLSDVIREGAIAPGRGTYAGGYCRLIGGFSLFDFRVPPNDVRQTYEAGWGWARWLNAGETQDRVAIWLKIDHVAQQSAIIEPTALWNRQAADPVKRKLIRYVEACHLGPMPTTAIVDVLCVDVHDRKRHGLIGDIANAPARIEEFISRLPPAPPPNPIVAALSRPVHPNVSDLGSWRRPDGIIVFDKPPGDDS